MNKKLQTLFHLLIDLLAAALAWSSFFLYRKQVIEAGKHGYEVPVNSDYKLLVGLLAIPIFWILIYAASGYYRHIFRRSRLQEVEQTLVTGIFGCLTIFFVLLLDDSVSGYRDYYNSLLVYASLHLGLTMLLRIFLVSRTIYKIQHRKWGYNTLLVGDGQNAVHLYRELESAKKSEGFFIKGFLRSNTESETAINGLPCLGNWKELCEVVAHEEIEDVIVCLDDADHHKVPMVVDLAQNAGVQLKIMPDTYGMVLGMVKMNNILGATLVEVDFEAMPPWQKTLKRLFDVVVSLLAIVLLLPVFLIIAIAIKLDSPGSVFFSQERIGFRGQPFRIIKFRSMRTNAEISGPQLSRENDDRRTRVGTILRKTRLDELPQFFNVLVGSMSIVGPRPERQFFIDQIVKKAPYYTRLHRIKPGITSWGQVKFGYAENVDQMIERMKYDLLYLENMSLGLDVKIMIYTALIMVQGRGK